jgi:hypothetical protein
MALVVGGLFIWEPARAENQPLMTYSVDLVSDYVARGEDLYVRRFAKYREAHAAVNFAPAAQPSVTFFGPTGLSLNLLGSFALSDRADDAKKQFVGLGRDDELDYTLAFDWSNRLGGFTAGLIYYTYFDACYASERDCTTQYLAANPPRAVQPDAMIKWAMPFAKSMNSHLAYFANPTPGGWYAVLGISGGERVIWAASLGEAGGGVRDLTAKISLAFGDVSVSANGAYRPHPELVGPYQKDGTYTTAKGRSGHYPPAIFWLSVAWGGRIAAQ